MQRTSSDNALPLPEEYSSDEAYIQDLLTLVKSSELLKSLCGGVHILDFFIRDPDLYESLLDPEWRAWFELHEMSDLLDLVLRENLDQFASPESNPWGWRGKQAPPASLISYLANVRRLTLNRHFTPTSFENEIKGRGGTTIPSNVATGMGEKKIHEVDHFARYVNRLTDKVSHRTNRSVSHLVDFGSGRNYLGRTLASKPYNRKIVAVESRHHVVEGAKNIDLHAKLSKKPRRMVNKKEYRSLRSTAKHEGNTLGVPNLHNNDRLEAESNSEQMNKQDKQSISVSGPRPALQDENMSIQYVEKDLENGDLTDVIRCSSKERKASSAETNGAGVCSNDVGRMSTDPFKDGNTIAKSQMNSSHDTYSNIMVISLHSCGNLSHHGLRSIILNHNVRAVAIVGCCYNLLTERYNTTSWKHPALARTSNSNILHRDGPGKDQSNSYSTQDRHGFPMSEKLRENEVYLNITARMMAVQAPCNWTREESENFFKRHFYRSLLQRMFLDFGVITPPASAPPLPEEKTLPIDQAHMKRSAGPSDIPKRERKVGGSSSGGQPIIIGSLRKSCYVDFPGYVRGALSKLSKHASNSSDRESDTQAEAFPSNAYFPSSSVLSPLASQSEEEQTKLFQSYADSYADRKKHLSIVWTLMAYSAQLIEAVIVVDRWLWLKEQRKFGVRDAWVEPVFDYHKSPRNLVVVGIKGDPDADESKIINT